MTIRQVPDQQNTNVATVYEVTEIAPEEIQPSENFRRFVQEQKEFPFLNRFTLEDFTNQVREQFANRQVK